MHFERSVTERRAGPLAKDTMIQGMERWISKSSVCENGTVRLSSFDLEDGVTEESGHVEIDRSGVPVLSIQQAMTLDSGRG